MTQAESHAVAQQYESSLQTQLSQLQPPHLGVDLVEQPAPPLPPPLLQSAGQFEELSPASQVPSPQVPLLEQPDELAQLAKLMNLD